MNKLKLMTFLFLMAFTEVVMACPGCAGSMGNPRDKYLVYILSVFIILCYIPFYFIYKTIIKYRNFNDIIDNVKEAE